MAAHSTNEKHLLFCEICGSTGSQERGFHAKRRNSIRPDGLKRTPSRSSNIRWVSSAPGTRRRLTLPCALITRCHGTVVPFGNANIA
jgi:hypothetical protein